MCDAPELQKSNLNTNLTIKVHVSWKTTMRYNTIGVLKLCQRLLINKIVPKYSVLYCKIYTITNTRMYIPKIYAKTIFKQISSSSFDSLQGFNGMCLGKYCACRTLSKFLYASFPLFLYF